MCAPPPSHLHPVRDPFVDVTQEETLPGGEGGDLSGVMVRRGPSVRPWFTGTAAVSFPLRFCQGRCRRVLSRRACLVLFEGWLTCVVEPKDRLAFRPDSKRVLGAGDKWLSRGTGGVGETYFGRTWEQHTALRLYVGGNKSRAKVAKRSFAERGVG